MLTQNPLTKLSFIMINVVFVCTIFMYSGDNHSEVVRIVSYVLVFIFLALVLRADTLGEVAKGFVEALRGRWSK